MKIKSRDIVIALIFLLVGAVGTFFYNQIAIRGDLSVLQTDGKNVKEAINTINLNLGRLRDAFNRQQSDPEARVEFEAPKITFTDTPSQRDFVHKEGIIYAKYEKVGKELGLPTPIIMFEKISNPFLDPEVESEGLIYTLINLQRNQLGLTTVKKPSSPGDGFIKFKPNDSFDLRVQEFMKLKMLETQKELLKSKDKQT